MAHHLVNMVERFRIFKSFDAGYQKKNGLRIDYTMQPMPIWSICWLWDSGMELVSATSLMVFTMES